MTGVTASTTTTALDQAELHASLRHPLAESMDFLNGVALSYPDAISFAAGRPTERFLDLDDVLEDNPYGLFPADDAPRPPTLKALDRDRRVVYLGSYGKTGLPGARVGFAVADQLVRTPDGRAELLADQLGRLKSMLTVNTSPLAQAAIGGKLLANRFSLRAANEREREVYRGNLRRALAGLVERFPAGGSHGVSWNTPGGGFFLVLTVPFTTDDALLEVSARAFRVVWTPMHHFYGDGVPVTEMRLSISNLTHEEIDTGLDRLAAFIQSQSR